MENKIIWAFESNMTLMDFFDANNIEMKSVKKILEEYIDLFMTSKVNVKYFGLELLKKILREFEEGKSIRKISFEYDMLDEDVAKIIHVMLFNKNKNNLKYNFIVLPKKDDKDFILKCKQVGIVLDKYFKQEIKDKKVKTCYKNNYKNFKTKYVDNQNQLIIDMYNNYYTIYKIAEYLNLKVRSVIKVLNDYYKDSEEIEINKIMPVEFAVKLLEDGLSIEDIQDEYGVPIEYLKIILNIDKELKFNFEDYDKSKLEENIIKLYLLGKYKSKEIAEMLNTTDTIVSIVINEELKGKYLSTPKTVAAILKNNASLNHLKEYSKANNVILTDYSVIEGYKLANKITLKK